MQYIFTDVRQYEDFMRTDVEHDLSCMIDDAHSMAEMDPHAPGVVVGPDAEEHVRGLGVPHWQCAEDVSALLRTSVCDHSPNLADIDVPPLQLGEPCSIVGIEEHIKWTTPELVLFVGPYGCGKSSMARLLAYELITNHQVGGKLHICAWEDEPDQVQNEFATYLTDRPISSMSQLTADELQLFRAYGVKYYMPDANIERTFHLYFEHVRQCAALGYKTFIFDPWNEHDYALQPGQTETNYVREILRTANNIKNELGINMWIITHIAGRFYDEGKVKPFRTGNAFGSTNFGNKATRGICIMRVKLDDEDYMLVRFDKVKREKERGRLGVKAFKFDDVMMTLKYDAKATEELAKEWQ